MKRFLILCAFAITLGGCAGTPVGDALRVATSTVTNPVKEVNIYQVKSGYAAVLEVAASYRDYCWSKSFAALMADPIAKPICEHRRSVMRAVDKADDRAFDAITRAETFIRNNPTISAVSVVREAWAAVQDFQSAASNTAATIAAK
jgi:hypothetical protein